MIYLNTIKTNLTNYLNFTESLTRQQKIVYTVACAVFAVICAFSIYYLYRACCLKKEQLPPADQKAKKVAEKIAGKKNPVNAPKVDPKKEPEKTVSKAEEKIVPIAVGIDWTAEEIRSVDQAIPQWLLRHFPGIAPEFIDTTFQEKGFVPISQKDTVAKHREKFNLQLQQYIKVLSAHSNLGELNPKIPILLRALHIPQNCSDIERMAYTYIMQQAWTNIVREGLNSECYPYVFPRNGGSISEDSFKILEDTLEANKNHPQVAQILTAFPLAKWNQMPTPQLSVSQVGSVFVFDVI